MRRPLFWTAIEWRLTRSVPSAQLSAVLGDLLEDYRTSVAARGRWRAELQLIHEARSVVSAYRHTMQFVAREESREGMRHMLQDLRFGVRLFRKHPLPIGIAVIGLGLAIGAVTTVFSLVNATLLRPYGMSDPASVMQVARPMFGGHMIGNSWPYERFLKLQSAGTLAGVEATVPETARVSLNASDDGVGERQIAFVSDGYLDLLGARPAIGRSLQPNDDRPDAPPVVVLSHRLWTAVGEPASIAGRKLWINGAAAEIVGVLRPEFSVPAFRQPEAWSPFHAFDRILKVPQTYLVNGRVPESMGGEPFAPSARTLVDVVARLRPEVSQETARQNLYALANAAVDGAVKPANAKPTEVRLFSAASPIDGPNASGSWLTVASMLGLVGLVLAVACANTGNLLLASAATRGREIGVRLALGATRRRLLRQMILESLLISGAAAAIGFFLAFWLSPIAAGIVGLDTGVDVAPDARVLLFSIGVALVAGLAGGLAPARFGARGNLVTALQSQAGNAGPSVVPSRLRSSFIGLQSAVSILLLVAAALLWRTALRTTVTDVGYDADRLLSIELTTPEKGLDERAYVRQALETVRALPNVEQAGTIEKRPFGTTITTIRLAEGGESFAIYVNRVDSAFLRAAGVRLLSGRFYTEAEEMSNAPVALISESIARRFYGESGPLGRSLSALPAARPYEDVAIIGVVADVMLNRVHSEGVGGVFRPLAVKTDPASAAPPALIVRTATPGATARVVEQALRPLDPRVRPKAYVLQRDVEKFAAGRQMLAWLSGPIAVLALILAALGIYGVTTFVVSRRTPEVSLRMALGASAADVRWLLVRDSLRPVLIGLVIGLGVALAAAKIYASLLPGISPFDPIAIGAALLVLGAAAFGAAAIPARAAGRIDPAEILRQG